MSLLVSMHFHDPIYGEKTYTLKAEAIDHVFTRIPAQAGLPGVETQQAPVIIIDLGVCVQQITVNGYVDSDSTDSSNPTKDNLEYATLKWWKYGDDTTTLMQITLPGGTTYPCSVKMASFHMDGAQEDRWSFSLTFLVSVPVS
jgi:hypothetical protein